MTSPDPLPRLLAPFTDEPAKATKASKTSRGSQRARRSVADRRPAEPETKPDIPEEHLVTDAEGLRIGARGRQSQRPNLYHNLLGRRFRLVEPEPGDGNVNGAIRAAVRKQPATRIFNQHGRALGHAVDDASARAAFEFEYDSCAGPYPEITRLLGEGDQVVSMGLMSK